MTAMATHKLPDALPGLPAEGWAKTWADAARRVVPLVRVWRDGPRHVGLEIDLAPTRHELTDAVAEAVWDQLRQAIDRKGCRRETTLAVHAGGSAFWARRIPRERAGEVLGQVLALINRDGAAVVRDRCELPFVFRTLWGRSPTWAEVERWRPTDVRAALRRCCWSPPSAPWPGRAVAGGDVCRTKIHPGCSRR